jgi:hypothetical protein
MDVKLDGERIGMGLELGRDFFQLRAGFRNIAQSQPAYGGGEMMAVRWFQRFHVRIIMREKGRI